MRARLNQQETEARVRTDAILEQLVNACRQVGRSSFTCAIFLKISRQIEPVFFVAVFSLHKCIIIMSLVQVGELEVNEAKASEELSQLRNEVQ